MTPENLKALIEENMSTSHVEVSAEGDKYTAVIVSNEFEGLSMLKSHKVVYAFVNPHITSGAIHALTLKTYTEDGWAKQQ